jgi:hypothetical protein
LNPNLRASIKPVARKKNNHYIIKTIQVNKMKNLTILPIMLALISCAGTGDPQGPTDPSNPVTPPAVPQKSPHGYVVGGDPERFGGFIGDCSSDENFAYYWQCQSENAGNDFH